MYSLDAEDRYFANIKARKAQTAKRKERNKHMKEYANKLFGSQRLNSLHVKMVAATSHLQNMLSTRFVYSLPADLAMFQDLDEALVGRRPNEMQTKRRRILSDSASIFNVDDKDVVSRVFFKVVDSHPSSGKHSKGMPASTTWLQRSDFAVTRHKVDFLEDGTWDVDMEPLHAAGSDHVRIRIVHLSPDMIDKYAESFAEHRHGGGLQY